jgi:hypothetical protein
VLIQRATAASDDACGDVLTGRVVDVGDQNTGACTREGLCGGASPSLTLRR